MESSTIKLANGIALTLHTPTLDDRNPVIILCQGFCGIRKILLPAFADVFAKAGFATITFDYRGFGDSEGERGRLEPARQIEDIHAVIAWVREQPSLDAERIGLWGTSFGGCHVIAVAAQDRRIKCVVSQLAFADGEALVTATMEPDEKADFIATLDKMAQKKAETGKEMMVGITRVVSDSETKAFFEQSKQHYPEIDVKIPFLTIRETLHYKPASYAANVFCPTLVVIAGKDTINPPEQGRALYHALAAREKVLYEEQEARHYDVYSGEYFGQIAGVERNWFERYL
ncbi:UilS family quorum-quenching N-acyl-homoserine lactonase [Vagococcus sp. WN89Y]|uniref:UilS family quorum-quenching N-acyl-homoserine lactonase n=1 Tax=Vagococcus sp. WN89Y TaxID=3457258 RepID=UPI003FCCD9C5